MTAKLKENDVELLINEKQLSSWLSNAKLRRWLEYHRGFLVIDRDAHLTRLGEPERRQLDRVAEHLFLLAASGCGHLLQRRIGRNDYSYLFVLRPGPFNVKSKLLIASQVQP
jgi:hypothetical protein